MAVPEEYVAVWARETIGFDDGPAGETEDVRWIQTSELYTDLRLERGGDGAVSFGGTCTAIDPTENGPSPGLPRLRWSHELELERDAGSDTLAGVDEGAVSWEDGDLIERGSFDGPNGPIVYTEVWRRLDPGSGPCMALASTDGTSRLAMLGSHCLTICDERVAGPDGTTGEYLARYQVRGSDGWVDELSLGQVDVLPDPPEGELIVGDLIHWAGRTWLVVEYGPVPGPVPGELSESRTEGLIT